MDIQFLQPVEPLRGVLARIYVHDAAAATPDAGSLIVPDGDVKLIFPLRGEIRCRIGDRARLHRESRLIVSGMRTKPGHLWFGDGMSAIGLIVRPAAAYRLLRVSHHELLNCTLDGEEIFDGAARRWQEEVMNLPTLEDQIARLQARLCEWLRRSDRRDRAFERAVWCLQQREGRARIEELAREVGWSRRHLERKFKEYLGVGPKRLASVLRFHFVYKRMRGIAAGHYNDLVQDHYFDQSHFLKEFKRYTGATPRRFAETDDYGRIYVPK